MEIRDTYLKNKFKKKKTLMLLIPKKTKIVSSFITCHHACFSKIKHIWLKPELHYAPYYVIIFSIYYSSK